ncbi:MAG: valine--tRNA ligase [Nitrospirae bacterium]|nr:valine--tRNA ligase [Nitrospirota bacterium]
MEEQIKNKAYDPKSVEERWYEFWLENDCFKPPDSADGGSFSIVIPPPNVTGSLHMGHALNVTLQDILARWKRMSGKKVLWLPGTDHAGIATQNVVERQLASEGIDRHSMGRKAFIARVWEWKQRYGGHIIHQLKKMGASCDWSRERFTLDEGLSTAVRKVFVGLFEEGLIYRALRLINWCPRCFTALSDLEVEHEEAQGRLTFIRYPIVGDGSFVTVATTRPETMLGDTAVAVNPDDPRYANFIGKMVRLPLTNRLIPIVADREVDMQFGTGAVKVTPSHDFNDEAIARRQSPNLPFVTVIGEDGRMTAASGKRYAGLDRYECRKVLVSDLKDDQLLEKDIPHNHAIGHCYRCKTVIEPLPTTQWYVKVESLAGPAIEAVRSGKIKIVPEGWKNNYFSWMENIRDWCISRQIWWGHQIPAWYCPRCTGMDGKPQGANIFIALTKKLNGLKEGSYLDLRAAGATHESITSYIKYVKVDINVKPLSGIEDVTACPECGNLEILRDPDVLDTWFSSALWPFSTLGWPENTGDLKDFYPTSVLVTGFDILFFWVARMIMMGLKFMKDVPFGNVYIHALVRDEKGQKMSKSKGNVIDPLIMIEKYGTDAFRFSLAAFAAQGRDVRFSEDRVEGYRHFINKFWNASRFINLNISKYGSLIAPDTTMEQLGRDLVYAAGQNSRVTGQDSPVAGQNSIDSGQNALAATQDSLNLFDRWILSRLSYTSTEIERCFDEYRFNDAANAIYHFIWHEFCDWYIELSKTSLEKEDPYTLKCLLYVFDNAMKLLHPFMPFVTEELWQSYAHETKTIMLVPYPHPGLGDDDAEKRMQYIIDVISSIRSIRGELNVSPSKPLHAMIKTMSTDAETNLRANCSYIINLAHLESLRIGAKVEKPKGSATAVTAEMEVFVPLSGLFDVKAELERLSKELRKLNEVIDMVNKKLMNEDFRDKAPKNVLEKEKAKFEELVSKKDRILSNVNKLRELESDDTQSDDPDTQHLDPCNPKS